MVLLEGMCQGDLTIALTNLSERMYVDELVSLGPVLEKIQQL